jgi:F-box-like
VTSFHMADQAVCYASIGGSRPARKQLLLPWLVEAQAEAHVFANQCSAAHDQLAMWAVNAVHVRNGQPPPWGLLAMPEGVLVKVLSQLRSDDLLACACTSKALQEAAEADSVWVELCKEDFGEVLLPEVRFIAAAGPCCNEHVLQIKCSMFA